MAAHRILVVEDEGIVALDIQSKLEAMGYDVPRVVASADAAVQAATELRPDLVLMDIQLEGQKDGVDAAERIHAELAIPVVYLTAYSDESTLERAKATRPFGYLLKPFEQRELYTTVEIAIYRHRAEREKARLEERLQQAEKMEAIGQLTAGVAHHFNLMLQGIVGNLDLAVANAPDDLRPLLDDAAYDADRAARLVRQLTLFFGEESSGHIDLDLADLLREVADMCRSIFPRRVAIELELDADLPPVRGNRGQLRHCLANLCANARDAATATADDEHHIRLRAVVGSAVQPAARHDQDGPPTESPVVRVDIIDDGIGMDADTQARIFEPFFTTKEGAGPAGLGLAAVYGIVRDHGGWLECDSHPGQGTTMSIFLPVADGTEERGGVPVIEASALPTTADVRPYRGDENVLVVADVDRFRKVIDLMLERHGYRVQLGRDGRDGIELFRHEHDNFDLVIVGLSQPASTSVEDLLEELRRIDPRARILVLTARPEAARRWDAASVVLLEPFNTYQLLKTARSLLDS